MWHFIALSCASMTGKHLDSPIKNRIVGVLEFGGSYKQVVDYYEVSETTVQRVWVKFTDNGNTHNLP